MSPAGVLFATFAVLMLLGSPITVALGAGDGADDVFRDGDKPPRNARAFHERPDEHEGGQGHDGKGIDRGEGGCL